MISNSFCYLAFLHYSSVLANIGYGSAMVDIVGSFWLSTITNFVKDGGILASYSDMAVPYVWFFTLRHDQPSTTLL